MTFGKRQLLIGALVAALGAAVYLNWQFSAAQPVSVTRSSEASSSKQLGQTTYVNTELSGEEAVMTNEGEENEEALPTEASEQANDEEDSLSAEQKEYFNSERKKRDELLEKNMEELKELAQSPDGSENAKAEAVKAVERLTQTIKAQADMEAEIKTKGFSECLVSLNQGSCTVIVPDDALNDAAAITLKDIVNRHSAVDFDKITITGR